MLPIFFLLPAPLVKITGKNVFSNLWTKQFFWKNLFINFGTSHFSKKSIHLIKKKDVLSTFLLLKMSVCRKINDINRSEERKKKAIPDYFKLSGMWFERRTLVPEFFVSFSYSSLQINPRWLWGRDMGNEDFSNFFITPVIWLCACVKLELSRRPI